VEPGIEEQCEEDEESSLTPTVESLWAFVYELTRGCDITSMTWNKKNPVTTKQKIKSPQK